MKVKICGIRSRQEALRVGEFQPDALGILVGFDPQIAPNNISEEMARDVVQASRELPYNVDTFLLTNKQDADTNIAYSKRIGNSHIQLLGDVSVNDVGVIRYEMPDLGIVKVIHVTGYEAVGLAQEYDDCDAVSALLLDSRIGYHKRGGTGQTHDWTISAEIARRSKKPVWLAGGLRTYNVRSAIETVRPYGVDVETGVQNPDGSKNYDMIKEFVSNSRP